jgi:uncharacterized protein DUF222
LVADEVTAWGPLSVNKTEQAIDAIVDQVDAGALRRSRKSSCQRDVEFGSHSDEAGFTSMWARLYAPDAVVLKQRVEEMARGVCQDDPRTLGERRSDALTAMAAGIGALACRCGATGRAAAGRDGTLPATAVIHVVADAATVDAARTDVAPDAGPNTEDAASRTDDTAVTAEPSVDDAPTAPASAPAAEHAVVPPAFCPAPAAQSAASPPIALCPPPALCPAPPAFVLGGGVLPAALLAATLERATVREIVHPGDGPPEPRYTPSRALADFVRCRDLTCRFPGCDRPATQCDLDHTVPYPVGPTHASNLKCLCRFHHIVKTFWGLDRAATGRWDHDLHLPGPVNAFTQNGIRESSRGYSLN